MQTNNGIPLDPGSSYVRPRERSARIDPQAWLADVLARIAAHPVQRLDDLLPWNWRKSSAQAYQAA
jgi:IS66 C-terminal element